MSLVSRWADYASAQLRELARWAYSEGAHYADVFVQDPLLAVVFCLAVIVFVVGLAILIIDYLRDRSDELLAAIAEADSVTILMHNNPDPDAMACALGIERLAELKGVEASSYYPGKIRHHENRAFRAVLDISFEQLSDVDEIADETLILVDHHSPRGFDGCEDITPDIIIDHHDGSFNAEDDEFEFLHIEPDIGACATLVTEYLEEQDFTFTESANCEKSVSTTLSTALLYGIMADTANLTQGVTERDYHAAMTLYESVDSEKLHRIASPKMDSEALDTKAEAISERILDGPFAVSDVGAVENPDSIPQAADELVQLEGVTAVVVVGEYDNEIRLSGRAYDDDRVHMGEALQTAVEEIPNATAGGHSEMGGGQIPMDVLEYSEHTRTEIHERIFAALHGRI